MTKHNKGIDNSNLLCPICGKSVKSVHDGGDGFTMWIEQFNPKGESCGIRPPVDGQDQVHIGCIKNVPENARFPFIH